MNTLTGPELKNLEEAKLLGQTMTAYRTMQIYNGRIYPLMTGRKQGEDGQLYYEETSPFWGWLKSEESQDADSEQQNGIRRVKLYKGLDPETDEELGTVEADYNPYFHLSSFPLNDRIPDAYKRDNLVTVQVEIPVSELYSGYHAPGARDAVGIISRDMGPIAKRLAEHGIPAANFYSRYCYLNRIVPDEEVAEMIADKIRDTKIKIPYNVISPSLRHELEKIDIHVSDAEELDMDNAILQVERITQQVREAVSTAERHERAYKEAREAAKNHNESKLKLKTLRLTQKQYKDLREKLLKEKQQAERKAAEEKAKAEKARKRAEEAKKNEAIARARAKAMRRIFTAMIVGKINHAVPKLLSENDHLRNHPSFRDTIILHSTIFGALIVFGKDIEKVSKASANFIEGAAKVEDKEIKYAYNIDDSVDEICEKLEEAQKITRDPEGNITGIVRVPSFDDETIENEISVKR